MYLKPEEISVLAVDDDRKFCEIISHYLSEDPKYSVITAESGKEALEILKTRQISAIIADFQMPDIDGIELLRILRTEGNDIPFVIFTGQGCESVAIQALNEGADFYLVKGEDPGPQFLVLRKNLSEIVARRQADEALRLSEAENRKILSLLRATLDATEDGVLVENNQGEIAWYNERLLQLLNLHPDEVEGKQRIEVLMSLRTELIDYNESGCPDLEKTFIESKISQNILSFKDGRVIETHVRPQICEGITIGRVWSYHDITARIQAEHALFESRERFRILFDNSPISHQALSNDGKIQEVNQTWLAMLGYTRDEVIGKPFIDFCTPESKNSFIACFRELRDLTQIHSIELILNHKDGREIIVIADGIVVQRKDNTSHHIQCSLRDITHHRKTEEQLRWTESLLEEIVFLLPFGICVTEGPSQTIIFENTQFYEIWQTTKSGNTIKHLTLPQVMDSNKAKIISDYSYGGEQVKGRLDVICAEISLSDRRILRSYQRKFSQKDDETRVLWAFENITRFKDQEEELRKYARSLEILNRMISLSGRAKEITSLCNLALESIIPLMNYDAGAVCLIKYNKKIPQMISSIGISPDMEKNFFSAISPICSEVITSGNPFFSENFSSFSPDLSYQSGICSIAIIPLLPGTAMQGAILLINKREKSISPNEKTILAGIGREIGGALVRLHDQDALRNSRKNLENLVNSISDMVFVLDADSETILDINEAVLSRLGYCREEMIGVSIRKPTFMTTPLFPSELFTDETTIRKHTIPDSEGNLIHVETSTARGMWNIRNAYFCVSRDITESLAAQELIHKSEERLRALFESSPIGLELYNAEGFLIDINPAAQEIFGISDKQAIIDLSLSKDPVIKKSLCTDIRQGRTVTYEKILDMSSPANTPLYRSHKKHNLEIRVIVTPLQTSNTAGNTGYLVIVEDITEKMQATRLLAESEAFNRGLITNLPDYVMIYNNEGQILYVNPSAITAMRAIDEKIIGNSIYTYIIPEYHKFVTSQIEKRQNGEDIAPYEIRIMRHDKSQLDVMVQATKIPYHGSEAVLVVLTDITLRKEAEEDLEKYTQVLQMTVKALESANKKLNLLSDVTRHDILNQVHIIFNYLDLARTESDPGTLTRYLYQIEGAVSFINQQIQFTRSYQDIGVNAPIWQKITDIIESLQTDSLVIMNNTDEYLVHADPLLPKVFENLLDNSVRHGGRVTRVSVQTMEHNDDIILIWSDNGKGIKSVNKERIFDKGYGQNTGFGLFLIREILALTGIQIKEIGNEGEGACFELIIPQGSYRVDT